MLVINFSNKVQYLKGVTLNVGANIISDDVGFTEADRSEIIGIGQGDLDHYNDVLTFLATSEAFVNENSKIISLHTNILGLKDLLKAEIAKKAESAFVEAQRNKNIISLSKKIKAYEKRMKTFFDNIELKPISENFLQVLDKLYSNVADDAHQDFTITQFAKSAYTEIKNTKKQVLGYELAQIKAVYVRS